MAKYCCTRMAYDLEQKCSVHSNRYDCPDCLIVETKSGFGLIVHDGGESFISIAYCPWCGSTLPESPETTVDSGAQ